MARLALITVTAWLALGAIGMAQAPSSEDVPPEQAVAAQALQVREEPGWFRVGVPPGWQLSADRDSGLVGVTSPDGRGVYVWLLLAPRPLQSSEAAALLG